MATESQTKVERPKNPGATFESWLKKKQQQERDDDTGRVARWVHGKMTEGEWISSESQKTSRPLGGKVLPADEQLLRTWNRHLVRDHSIPVEGIEIFGRVFGEYQQARDNYRSSLRQS